MTTTCTVVSRPSVQQPLDQEATVSIEFGEDTQEGVSDRTFQESGPFLWEAFRDDEEFHGRALRVVVSTLKPRREITRTLYQLDRSEAPKNNFGGGHGFTGLVYVNDPASPAELQYFCSVE